MKKIYINESQLLELNIFGGETFIAGTDHPYFIDPNTEEEWSADWNGDYGFPFGFWDEGGGSMVFSVGEAWSTHENACGKVAERYFTEVINEEIDNDVSSIVEKVGELMDDINSYGYKYNEEYDTYINDEGDELDLYNEADNLASELQFMTDYEEVYEILREAISNGGEIDENELSTRIMENAIGNQDFTTRDGIDRALELIGDSFENYFENGHSEGRIWPQKEMIGFYTTEQPDPKTLLYICQLLSQNDEIGVSYNELMDFHMVFEDWRNDGEVTCCTISDYVDGNYGPNSYEEDDDEPIQYNNGQKTVFVPHLANQDQKREYFKDFRNTRDRAVYVPRERGGNGNLAQYHAMRYPYGENKDNKGKKMI